MREVAKGGGEAPSALVIGAGITGVAAAERLRREGWRATLVDPVEPGDPEQASFGNGGILARCAVVPVSTPGLALRAPRMLLDPGSPLFLRWRDLPRLMPWLGPFLRAGREAEARRIAAALAMLTEDSVRQHQELAAGTPAAPFIRTGEYAYLYASRTAFEKDAWGFALRRELGFAWREADGAALRAADPALNPRYDFAAIFEDHGWIASPGGYVAALARHFLRQGGAHVKARARAIARDGTMTLEDGRTLRADRVILAAGVRSRELARGLGLEINMIAERGYHLELRGARPAPPIPYMIADAKFVATPMEGGLRCAGVVELADADAPPSAAPVRLLRRGAARLYPQLRWDEARSWMGRRPSTADSLPALGPVPGAPRVICAFGGQHVGLTIGPRLGRMAADLAAGRAPNADLRALAPERFGPAS
ncbi:NAD(P)/FAD-dependent oxidoreductase [Oceanicella actignis]|uniref:NAD(P)/FAD-dependent oxidoreductase n=1 Tax=Oceanicella actignis TaxID=1189325 RepID=UPI0011E81754|nr:FAD-binding oxidoreductase [Oceanicella actignis]TYO89920.1 D-amino-acid dehydrogenase [Oceanicella actignis]